MEYTGELVFLPIWNHFDEWGLTLSLPRISGEEITTYKSRLEDVIKHRAGPNHLGLFYGINRDLGLNVYHDALIIQTAKNSEGNPICPDLVIEVRSNGILLSSSAFRVIREAELVPSDTLRVRLTLKTVSRDIVIEHPLGTRISQDDYKFDWERNEIVFNDASYAGLTITLSYLYYEIVPTYGKTLQEVVNALNTITTPGGDQVVVASLKDGISGSLDAEGIPLYPATFVEAVHDTPTGEYYGSLMFPCGEASIRALNDEDFIHTIMEDKDSYYDTPLIRWIEQVKNLTRMGWENFTFDQTRFTNLLGSAVIPTLSDAKTTYWQVINDDSTTYSTAEADYLVDATGDNTLSRFGFADSELQSGIGGSDDLKVIVEDNSNDYAFTVDSYEFYTSPTGDLTYSGEELDLLQEGF